MDDFAACDFFVLRTPLLPFDEIESWSAGLAAAGAEADLGPALDRDRELLRARLRNLLARPDIREALFIASPGLDEGIKSWHQDPDGKKGRLAEESLVRYLLRMATRPTPFGLVAGCSLGLAGDESRLRLAPRAEYRRHTRLDMHFLCAVTDALARAPEIRDVLPHRPDPTLYQSGGRLRHVETRVEDGILRHRLVAIEATGYLLRLLERARDGAPLAELAAGLVACEPDLEISEPEAREYLLELVESGVLASRLAPVLTGIEPIHDLIDQLERHAPRTASLAILRSTRDRLRELDRLGVGVPPADYAEVAEGLAELPATPEAPYLFQVDLLKPAVATLGADVLAEVNRAVRLLHRLAGSGVEETQLETFRRDFVERYGEGREVRLVDAIDPEVGIGFGQWFVPSTEASPLLRELALPPPGSAPAPSWKERDDLLLRKVGDALARGAKEIEVTSADLARLPARDLPPLPCAFFAMASLAAPSPEALAAGDFTVHVPGVAGPSGARVLGRFCHLDTDLRAHVERHLRDEEALDPEAVFAEIVHLPAARPGNILLRPVLRRHEIPFLGRSGAPEELQLPITDLRVTVRGQEILLSSEQLGCRVVPRLTAAHHVTDASIPLYSLLWRLQIQGVRHSLVWSWGLLDALPFLPRVTSGRAVLARARWRVVAEELAGFASRPPAERFREARRWQAVRGIPETALLVDGDKQLYLDFRNCLNLDAFLSMVRRYDVVLLEELFPGPGELCVTGPEGRFCHELVVPFLRRGATPGRRLASRRAATVKRSFPPGSEWLYARLYLASALADTALRTVVAPLVRSLEQAGTIDRWFFLRYADPRHHLRLRFHGEPSRLASDALPALHDAVAPWLEAGQVWKLELGTYEREVERYGGGRGIELAERLWHADSDTVVAILERTAGAEAADARWKIAFCGIDRMAADFRLSFTERHELFARLQETYAREHAIDGAIRRRLAAQLRGRRRELEALLRVAPEEAEADPVLSAFELRSRRLAPIVDDLVAAEAGGELDVPLGELIRSYLHLFANRLLRSEARTHEMVLYDFLSRLYRSSLARPVETRHA